MWYAVPKSHTRISKYAKALSLLYPCSSGTSEVISYIVGMLVRVCTLTTDPSEQMGPTVTMLKSLRTTLIYMVP